MTNAHEQALRCMTSCLNDYIEDQSSSDPQDAPEAINAGHPVHNSVEMVESFYPGEKLPGPARVPWMDLLQVSRGERVTDRPNQETMEAAYRMMQWAEDEVEKLARHRSGEGSEAADDVAHSTDFRSVRWWGKEYTFTPTQAACVRVLWENRERGTPVLGEIAILDAAGSAGSRLRDVFDKGKHPAWQSMIVCERKGTFRLAEAPTQENPTRTPR